MLSPETFVAIDFETADHGRDSACSVGLVRVEGDRIVAREHRLIRPPRQEFAFTYLHGIAWKDVCDQPSFRAVWADLTPLVEGAAFFAAHNAPFDRSVLAACCEREAVPVPHQRFECTVALARRAFSIYPTRLSDVCRKLGIDLSHHHALSDAAACAEIVLAARRRRPLNTPRARSGG